MPRKRTTAAANEFRVPCVRIFRWLVKNAGAAESEDRFAEATRIYTSEAPGGLISTKAGGAAGALWLMHLVSIERAQSEYHRRVAISLDEEAAEMGRLAARIKQRMMDYRTRARADRTLMLRNFKLRRFGNLPKREITHWPSHTAREMHLTFRALGVAMIAAHVVRRIARRILARLTDADLSDTRLSIVKDAALKLEEGGFTGTEIAELMDIDGKKGDAPKLRVDRWRKTVERAQAKTSPRKNPGPSQRKKRHPIQRTRPKAG